MTTKNEQRQKQWRNTAISPLRLRKSAKTSVEMTIGLVGDAVVGGDATSYEQRGTVVLLRDEV